MFVDTATIEVRAGKGGDGRLSFRHEKYRPRGGPDGGDGGRGGDIILEVDHNGHTLSRYRTARKIEAENGSMGGDNRKHGKAGESVIVNVPVGTQVYEGDKLVADLTKDGQQMAIARGGRGGFGNAHFTSSIRQSPRNAELGEPGEARKLRLELKLVADIGLVGLPNAGKSTLLSVISNARPEVADYPFTTLVPSLGVANFDDQSILIADIPGLIEGASEGKGLGDDFLRHIERTAVLLHLIDAGSPNVVADWRTIVAELGNYNVDLSTKPRLTVLTKIETVEPKALKAAEAALKQATKQPIHMISAQAHQGLIELLRSAYPLVANARTDRQTQEEALPVIELADLPDHWSLEVEDGAYRLVGSRLEGFGRRTNWDSDDALERLRDILRKQGVDRELRRLGAEPGAIIRLGDHEFEWLG